MIERFKDREWALRANNFLLELEQVVPEEKVFVNNFLETTLKMKKAEKAAKKTELRKGLQCIKGGAAC